MKKHRKKVIAIFAACMFALMMMLNVSTTINGSNFSVEGYTALVSGMTGGGGGCTGTDRNCFTNWTTCSGADCIDRWVCESCSCSFKWVTLSNFTTSKCDY
jgi:hypothetical protein